jgi:hypothetical protein
MNNAAAVTVSTVAKIAKNVANTSSVTQTAQQAGDKANEMARKAYVCDILVSDHKASPHDCGLTGQRDIDSVASRSVVEVTSSIADDFAKLQYVDVCLSDGNDNCIAIAAMVDSGAEVCLANAHELSALNLTKIGTVTLSGAIGGIVTADLVKLRIANADCPAERINFVCAVTDSATRAVILNTEIIARLQRLKDARVLAVTTSNDDNDSDGGDYSPSDQVNGLEENVAGVTENPDAISAHANDNRLEHTTSDVSNQQSDVYALINEQRRDETLRESFVLAKKKRAIYTCVTMFCIDWTKYQARLSIGNCQLEDACKY